MTIRPGDEWGIPTESEPDLLVAGSDRDLSRALSAWPHPNPLIAFAPNKESNLARSIGLSPNIAGQQPLSEIAPRRKAIGSIDAQIDAIQYRFAGNKYLAMNALELGVSPQSLRASTRSRTIAVSVDGRKIFKGSASGVIVANGQFIGDADLVPRSHPGDGRLEIHIYALKAGERAAMRRRLATGTHLPHPRISTASGAKIRIEIIAGSWAIKADSEPVGRAGRLEVEILSPAARLLI